MTTIRRGILGFLIALLIGSLLGFAVSRWRVLRAGITSITNRVRRSRGLTGLDSVPS